MSAKPPLNGKSMPELAFDRQLDAAVEQDVAARDQRPRLLRVVGGRLPLRHLQRRVERPGRERLDPVAAEQRVVAPRQARAPTARRRPPAGTRGPCAGSTAASRAPRADLTTFSVSPSAPRSSRRAASMPSASASVSTRWSNDWPPSASARTSEPLTEVSGERKLVTGTIATSPSTSGPGEGDVDGLDDGESAGDADGLATASDDAGDGRFVRRLGGRGGRDLGDRARCRARRAARPAEVHGRRRPRRRPARRRRRSRPGSATPVAGARDAWDGPRISTARASDAGRSPGRGRSPRQRTRRGREIAAPRPGGRTGRERKQSGWRTRPDSNRRSPA